MMNSHSKSKRVPIAGPLVSDKEIQYLNDAAKCGWYEHSNDYVNRFENAFSNYIGVEYALALPSCTSAIHLSLLCLGIQPGDEIIVPDITWIATAAPIEYVGAQIVFADVDAKTWCLTPESINDCISENTKAIIAVDLYGNLPNYKEIRRICEEHNIALIEDAAQAIGSLSENKVAGSFGDLSCFSFHGSKTMTTGEGGMLVTNSIRYYKRAQFLSDHGRYPGDKTFANEACAYKYKMSNLQAAFGLGQLEEINKLVAKKRKIYQWYQEQLENVLEIGLNQCDGIKSSYWMVTLIINKNVNVPIQSLRDHLSLNNIDTRPFFSPLSSIPAFEARKQAIIAREKNKIAYDISLRGFNLPSALCLEEPDVIFVCDAIKSFFNSI